MIDTFGGIVSLGMVVVAAGLLLLFVLAIVFVIWAFARALFSKPKRRVRDQEADQMAQDLYHDLQRMEKRLETLETILLDRTKR